MKNKQNLPSSTMCSSDFLGMYEMWAAIWPGYLSHLVSTSWGSLILSVEYEITMSFAAIYLDFPIFSRTLAKDCCIYQQSYEAREYRQTQYLQVQIDSSNTIEPESNKKGDPKARLSDVITYFTYLRQYPETLNH